MDLGFLPALNATLNSAATALLVAGRRHARAGRVDAHRRTMLAATATSAVFLALYVIHKLALGFESRTLHVSGAPKAAYLVLLATHVVLAMTIPVFALALIALGLRDRRALHRRIARIAWPIWIYVSVTGVLIYVILYHLDPALR